MPFRVLAMYAESWQVMPYLSQRDRRAVGSVSLRFCRSLCVLSGEDRSLRAGTALRHVQLHAAPYPIWCTCGKNSLIGLESSTALIAIQGYLQA